MCKNLLQKCYNKYGIVSIEGDIHMQFIRIIVHIAILYLFYWLGTWIEDTFHLFIPGSVIGMVLFLIALLTGVFKSKWVFDGASFLIRHLPLLFLPITVGVIEYLHLFKGRGIWLVIIVLFSTVLVMVSGGLLSQWLIRQQERGEMR